MIFVETPVFTKQASGNLFADHELRQLQRDLIANPTRGDLIVGSGGLRKIRVAGDGGGKSGGFRVIYYIVSADVIFLLLAYAKSRKDTLSKQEIAVLKKLIEQA